jgi:Uma2 family endonuclease
MATTTTRLINADEFFDWANQPENRDKRFELVRGEIVEMSRPGKMHGMVCGNLAWILGNYVRQRKKGYVCSNDTGVLVERQPDTVRGPDVMLFDDAETADQVDRKFAKNPPLLAVEVLSPNDTMGQMLKRVREQLRFGTGMVWVVDPDARDVIVYRLGVDEVVLEENEELTGFDVLPGFMCRVAELFALPGC